MDPGIVTIIESAIGGTGVVAAAIATGYFASVRKQNKGILGDLKIAKHHLVNQHTTNLREDIDSIKTMVEGNNRVTESRLDLVCSELETMRGFIGLIQEDFRVIQDRMKSLIKD
jgi:hypothetical protein